MKSTGLGILAFFIALTASAQSNGLTINVHPGVELLTIVQKLAGKFPSSTPSAYEREVAAYFAPYQSHEAVKKIQSFKGTVYPDLTELGFCFSNFPAFDLYIPDSAKVWYKLYGKENVAAYLQACKDFALQTHFWQFYTQHAQQYKAWGVAIAAGIKKDSLIEKLNAFYKTKGPLPQFYICLDPLNGWGAHAIPNPEWYNPAYTNLKAYTIGFFSRQADSTQSPVFSYGNYATNLVWHEGSHLFMEELFTKYKPAIDSLSYLYNKEDAGMKSQNISNWTYCLNENMVRGIVIALFKQYKDARSWKKQNAQEVLNDFIYAEEISEAIYTQYLHGNRYNNFEDFFPVLLLQLKQQHPL